MAVFAPLVIMVVLMGLNNETTALAAKVYFFARLAHYVVYTTGLPYLRTLVFAVSFFCQAVIALRLFALIYGVIGSQFLLLQALGAFFHR